MADTERPADAPAGASAAEVDVPQHDIPSATAEALEVGQDEAKGRDGPEASAALPTESAGPSEPPVSSEVVDPAPTSSAGKGKGRAKAPSSLQLTDLPPLDTRGVELEDGTTAPTTTRARAGSHARARSASSLSGSVPFTPSARHAPDSPTLSLVASLRMQLDLVTEQAQQLNAKLVTSIGKHADLEDHVFALTEERTTRERTVQELEREKARWEESMNTGLLVERSAIRDEMQRLAAGLVEEERKRGTAEEQRAQVESEVDDLAATLFDQANTMVAAERMSRAQAEERLRKTEENLAAAEAAVRDMQQHMQSLAAPVSSIATVTSVQRRFLSSHPPYSEFAIFLQHLRALRPTRSRSRELHPPPAVPSLVGQPFIARAIAEDSDPTLRLDTSELGWVTRRAVHTAILAGELLIEPHNAAGLSPDAQCALCGKSVFHPTTPASGHGRFSLKIFTSPGPTQVTQAGTAYVFRVATADKDAKPYPLCRNGWCLERLRAACALWHFVRTGLIVPVWNAEDVDHGTTPVAANVAEPPRTPTAPAASGASASATPTDASTDDAIKQPSPQRATSSSPSSLTRPGIEPRRKSGWNLGLKSSWTGWGSRPTTPTPYTPAAVSASTSAATSRVTSTASSPNAEKRLGLPIEIEDKRESDQATSEPKSDAQAAAGEPKTDVEEPKVAEQDPKPADQEANNLAVLDEAKRPQSQASNHGSEDSFATATPTAQEGDLPAVENEKTDAAPPTESAGTADNDKDAATAVPSPRPVTPPTAPTADADAATPTAPSSTPPAVSPSKLSPNPPSPERLRTSPPPPARAANRPLPPPLPARSSRRPGNASPPVTPTEAAGQRDAQTKAPESPLKQVMTEGEGQAETAKEEAKEEVKEEVKEETKEEVKEEAVAPAQVAETNTEVKEDVSVAPAEIVENDETKPVEAQEPNANEVSLDSPTNDRAARTSDAGSDKTETDEPEAARPSTPPPSNLPPPPRHPSLNSSPAVPPPLPPRHSSSLPPPLTASGGVGGDDKAFLPADGEGWDVRAWRQVCKLKEDMWRARVGVVDE